VITWLREIALQDITVSSYVSLEYGAELEYEAPGDTKFIECVWAEDSQRPVRMK